ncbi:MAG: PQQ-dependent sugar dehydrogenase [Sphingobacteriales bacterium]|nr:MAG: PQQ-dependent sugar dehydrogenase [Sphingobacteriales bacterium]
MAYAVFLFSCSNKNSANNNSVPTSTDTSSNQPVETMEANTAYAPAFAGQTRVAGTKTSEPWQGTVLTKDLKKPWGIAGLPDGRLLITEKGGSMRIATSAGQLSDAITGAPAVDDKGQGGLLGLTIDPKFASNKMIYWAFSERGAGGTVTAIAKGTLSADEKTLQNITVIYRAIPAYDGDKHYGGRLLFDTEGNLVISTGERSDLATRPQAQELQSALGKIIRITTDGKPAAGNPFLNNDKARPEIFSYGHRNPLGLAMHPQTKEIWNSEMGPRGGDEINIIKAGINYGWPTITYGIEYGGQKINNGLTKQDGLEQPVYYWDPVLSPGGMTFYSGSNMPEWKNNLFIGGLSSKHIARLVIVNNKVTAEERLLAGENQRFRDVAQGSDGILYAITDEGRLYKIAKK